MGPMPSPTHNSEYTLPPLHELPDEELARLASVGDAGAEEILLGRYIGLVKSLSKPYYLQGAEREDIVQEGIIGLLEAIHSYAGDRQCSFRVFARLCISRQILSAVRAYSRQKCAPLNSSLSLQALLFSEADAEYPVDLKDESALTMDEHLISQERFLRVQRYIDQTFSPFEKVVFEQFMDGKSYQEIAQSCQRPMKSIDGTLQRIRKKLSQFFAPDTERD